MGYLQLGEEFGIFVGLSQLTRSGTIDHNQIHAC